MDDYLSQDDWRVKESANSAYSLQGLNQHISTMITSQYWLGRLYSEEVADAHKSGAMHIHDLGFLSVYCVGWDLKDLLTTGFKGVEGKAQSAPARHLRTALGQIVNFFYTMQGRSGRRAGFLEFRHLPRALRPLRRARLHAGQTVLAGIPVQPERSDAGRFPDSVHEHHDGSDRPRLPEKRAGGLRRRSKRETYGDFQPEMTLLNKAFAEVMYRRGRGGQPVLVPDPDLQHHARFRLGKSRLRRHLADDRQVRHPLLLELRQLGHETRRRAQHVLPAAARQTGTDQARRRTVRVEPADRVGRRRDDQPAATRLRIGVEKSFSNGCAT